MPKYTTEDLILYLYHETSEEKTRAIETAIESDWALKEDFEALKDSRQGLNSILESPRPQSVTAILNYAKKTATIEH